MNGRDYDEFHRDQWGKRVRTNRGYYGTNLQTILGAHCEKLKSGKYTTRSTRGTLPKSCYDLRSNQIAQLRNQLDWNWKKVKTLSSDYSELKEVNRGLEGENTALRIESKMTELKLSQKELILLHSLTMYFNPSHLEWLDHSSQECGRDCTICRVEELKTKLLDILHPEG